jgi:hypothetical protein
MLEKKTWEEFRETGLTLIVNQILQIFGWSIVYDVSATDGKIIDCYPARTKFRGYSNEIVQQSYLEISRWMKENADQLLKEAED